MAMQLCPRCGSGARDTATECMVCGAALTGDGAPSAEAPAPATPAAPVPAPPQPAYAPPAPVSAAPDGLEDFVIPGMEPGPSAAAAPANPASEPSYLRAEPGPAPATPSPSTYAAPPPPPVAGPQPLAAQPQSSQPPPPPSGIPGLSLPPPTQPNYMTGAPPAGGAGGGEVRVSLTGEVMEVPQQSARGTGPGGYGPPPGAGPGPKRPGGPMPAGPPRARGAGIAYEEPKKKGSPVALILVLILLIGGGAGGWYWYNNRTNPKDQALAVYTAFFKDQDWKKLYPLVALSEADKKKYPDADTFEKEGASKITSNPLVKAGMDNLKSSLSDIAVGEPAVTGNKAEVPTSAKVAALGTTITMKGTAHMIKEGGVWKLDTTGDDSQNAQAVQDLLGKPEGGLPGMMDQIGGQGGAPGGAASSGGSGGGRGRRGRGR